MSLNVVSLHERVHQRSGHIAVVYKNRLLVWGGYREPLSEGMIVMEQEYHFTDEVWSYNCNTELWDRILTSGDIPRLVCGSCGVVLDDDLYVFGGYCRDENGEGNSNDLHRLDLTTMTWKLLQPEGQRPAACDKLAGWAYKNKVYFFGGFGPRPAFQGSGCYSYVVNDTGNHGDRGWNNQLVVYNPRNNEWEWPRVGGTAPSPRAAHAADVSGHKAYIFGGRFLNFRKNDLYCLDMKEMRWSPNLTNDNVGVPQGRSWHSFTFVSPDRAVIYGGLSNGNHVLNDFWFLDVAQMTWIMDIRRRIVSRYWHATRYAAATDELFAVGSGNDHPGNMLLLDFSPKSLLRLCLSAVLKTVPRSLWQELPKVLIAVLMQRVEQSVLFEDETLDLLPEAEFPS